MAKEPDGSKSVTWRFPIDLFEELKAYIAAQEAKPSPNAVARVALEQFFERKKAERSAGK